MLIETISFITFVSKTVAASTDDSVVPHHNTSLPQCKACLGAFLAAGIIGETIDDKVVQNSIGISSRSDDILS